MPRSGGPGWADRLGLDVTRRYRVTVGQLVPALMGGGLFILVALGAAAQPWRQVGAGGVIIAVLAGGAGCVAATMALTTQVTLTPAEISYRASLRRGAIGRTSSEYWAKSRCTGPVSPPTSLA